MLLESTVFVWVLCRAEMHFKSTRKDSSSYLHTCRNIFQLPHISGTSISIWKKNPWCHSKDEKNRMDAKFALLAFEDVISNLSGVLLHLELNFAAAPD